MPSSCSPSTPSSTPAASSSTGCTSDCPETTTTYHTQEQSNSCVVASSRNMIDIMTGNDIPESQLRDEMRDILGDPDHDFETTPINPRNAEELLENNGVPVTVHNSVPMDDLGDHLHDDNPIMVGFRDPGHRVILHSITQDADGNNVYNVIDPDPAYGGAMREMSSDDFQDRYNPSAIVIVPD